jgi:hypothetical protein
MQSLRPRTGLSDQLRTLIWGDYSVQVARAKGPFIIRTRAQSFSRLEILVYLLTDGNLVKIDDLDNPDLSDPITRFLERSRRLDVKTLNGYHSYYADEIQKTLEKQQSIKGLDKLIGAFEISKILKIGDQVLKIGNVEIPITTETEDPQGLGDVSVAEFSLYRINKIVTEEYCSFDGFDKLDDFFGAYVIPRQVKDMKHKSNDFMIVCQNKDAYSTAMNRGGWSLKIKVLPREFEDR